MTKLRAPLTFEDAITRIAGHMGWQAAAASIRKEERTLRAYSDPDDPRGIPLADALELDTAYQRAGGEGTPILDTYVHRLDVVSGFAFSCQLELARRIARAAHEGGEAVAALIAAAMPGATDADRALALREARQASDAMRATFPMLDPAVTRVDTS